MSTATTPPQGLVPAAIVAPPAACPAGRPLVRVLHIVNGEHYAGAERVQDLLALTLPGLGYEVGFACLKHGQFAGQRKSQQTSLFQVPMTSRFDVPAAKRIAAILRQENFQLIHTHTARSAMIGRLAAHLTKTPMVHHVHSPTSHDTTHRWRNRVNAWVERGSLMGVPQLIAVSESLGRHLRGQGYAAERVTVVHNGVPGPDRLFDRAPPLPRGMWTLGMVALFRPRKGVESLLTALALLRAGGRNVRLRAIGQFESREYEAEIHARVSRLQLHDAVEWTGFTSDVPAELAQLDALVLPSLFGEGLPMVVLEAMAHGVPIVATAVEGVPEAIRNGQDGLLARPGDAEDLARVVASLTDGLADWQSLRTNAFARQQAHFSDHAMASAVAQVYAQVLAAR